MTAKCGVIRDFQQFSIVTRDSTSIRVHCLKVLRHPSYNQVKVEGCGLGSCGPQLDSTCSSIAKCQTVMASPPSSA